MLNIIGYTLITLWFFQLFGGNFREIGQSALAGGNFGVNVPSTGTAGRQAV
jgi:hypothetical protein